MGEFAHMTMCNPDLRSQAVGSLKKKGEKRTRDEVRTSSVFIQASLQPGKCP